MNLIVLALLAISLLGSEWGPILPVDDWPTRLIAVWLTVALVPAVALFQTGIVLGRFQGFTSPQSFQASCRRLIVFHSIIWLTASAAIIWVLRWQDLVRGTWGLDKLPLIDDLVLLIPAISGLVLSWMIFYELQREFSAASPVNVCSDGLTESTAAGSALNRLKISLRSRWEFVIIRFRVYFLPTLVPAAVVHLFLDLHRLGVSDSWLQLIALGTGLAAILGWPWLALSLWKTREISNPVLAQLFRDLQARHRIFVRDFRLWETGQQMANAAVVGLIPSHRFIFISDLMLDHFPHDELLAIAKHEAGHIRLRHVCWRISFLLLPILVLSCHQSWLVHSPITPVQFNFNGQPWHFEVAPVWASLVALVGLFAWFSHRWLSHQWEFEADLYSAGPEPNPVDPVKSEVVQPAANSFRAMRFALLRLSAYAGDDWKKSTLFHPSLRQRIEFLDAIERNPQAAVDFKRKSRWRRNSLVLAWLLLAAAAAIPVGLL